jgi:hypothetical protein
MTPASVAEPTKRVSALPWTTTGDFRILEPETQVREGVTVRMAGGQRDREGTEGA